VFEACQDALIQPRIDWHAKVGNDGSRRIAEKLGFTMEGMLRQWQVNKGERRDTWVGGLLRGELVPPRRAAAG
jgi:RimJ/RimL family protein N-acetyltransferase